VRRAAGARARPGPTLRGRIAAWLAGVTLTLTLAALLAAFLAVRGALRAELRQALQRDAAAVAAAYDGEPGSSVRPGPTGRVVVQVYGLDGALIAASDPAFERRAAWLPPEVVAAAPSEWRGRRAGSPVQAAAAPFRAGTVVVLADASYVGAALGQVARALAWVGLALALTALPLAWLASRATTTPLRRLARAARRVDDQHLEPLGLTMPDDDVGRLATVLDELLARLRDARDQQRRFLAETSHELRTPLTSLRGFLARARRGAGPEAGRDLDDAERIAAGMARLVEDLLELSRGRVATELDLHLVAIGAEIVAPVAAEVEAEVARGAADPLVLADPSRLRQVLRNLLANARRAAGPDGRVRVGWSARDGEVRAWVEDDGPGIPEERRETLFEPFRPGPGGGTGLGLAIARQLTVAHGGRIEVDAAPGATRFTVVLPSADEVEEDAARPDGPPLTPR
jgi:signal transduction histidine kinase